MIIFIDDREYLFDSSSVEGRFAHALFRVREELREYWRSGERERVHGFIQQLRQLRCQFFTARYTQVVGFQASLGQSGVLVR